MIYQNFSNQCTSGADREREPRYFDFLRFRKHNHTLHIIQTHFILMNRIISLFDEYSHFYN